MALKPRLLALVTVALACLASATAASASPSSPVTVVLYAPGQSPTADSTTIGQLESGCPIATSAVPALYGAGGSPTPAITANTSDMWAVATLLTGPGCLPTPVPLNEIDEVIVDNAGGQPQIGTDAVLTPSDLTMPSDFANAQEWPVFWDAGTVDYVRPSRSATDDNAADAVQSDGLELDVYIDGAKPLNLTITASPANPDVNAPVTLSIDIPAGTKNETYDWSFDDGSPDSTVASPTRSFPVAGIYNVAVQASGTVDGYGSLKLEVGSPSPQAATTPVKSGPAKSSGGTPRGSAGTRKHGPATAKQHSAKNRPSEQRATATTTQTSTDAASQPSTPGGGSAGGRGSGGGGSAAGHNPSSGPGAADSPASSLGISQITAASKHDRTPVREPPAKVGRHDRQVSGRVLGTVEPLPGGIEKLEQTAASAGSAPALAEPAGPGPWALIAAFAVVLLLLGLGAGRELRHVRSAR